MCVSATFSRLSELQPMEQTRSKIVGLFLASKSPKEILNNFKDEKVCFQLTYRTIRRYKDTGSVKIKFIDRVQKPQHLIV